MCQRIVLPRRPRTGHIAVDIHIRGQRDLLRSGDPAVRTGAVIDKCIAACKIERVIAVFRPCFPAVFIRHDDWPAVRIEAHCMDAYLVILRAVIKARVIDKIPLSVVIMQHGIVSGCHIGTLHAREHVIRHQLQADRIQVRILRKHHVLAGRILERSERTAGASDPHIVAAGRGQPAVGHEQIVKTGLRVVLNERTFAGLAVSAGNLRAEIAVHHSAVSSRAGFRVNAFSGCRVDLQRKDAA